MEFCEMRGMEREEFEALLVGALSELPSEFRDRLDNVDVVVEDRPTRSQLLKSGVRPGWDLLGLYEGVPQTRRSRWYNMTLPDRITLFQQPIEAKCRSREEIAREIKRVLCHEIAHHFGIDEDSLSRIEGQASQTQLEVNWTVT
jgi:predicted Zn-dependent protease with MMP-like domain